MLLRIDGFDILILIDPGTDRLTRSACGGHLTVVGVPPPVSHQRVGGADVGVLVVVRVAVWRERCAPPATFRIPERIIVALLPPGGA